MKSEKSVQTPILEIISSASVGHRTTIDLMSICKAIFISVEVVLINYFYQSD